MFVQFAVIRFCATSNMHIGLATQGGESPLWCKDAAAALLVFLLFKSSQIRGVGLAIFGANSRLKWAARGEENQVCEAALVIGVAWCWSKGCPKRLSLRVLACLTLIRDRRPGPFGTMRFNFRRLIQIGCWKVLDNKLRLGICSELKPLVVNSHVSAITHHIQAEILTDVTGCYLQRILHRAKSPLAVTICSIPTTFMYYVLSFIAKDSLFMAESRFIVGEAPPRGVYHAFRVGWGDLQETDLLIRMVEVGNWRGYCLFSGISNASRVKPAPHTRNWTRPLVSGAAKRRQTHQKILMAGTPVERAGNTNVTLHFQTLRCYLKYSTDVELGRDKYLFVNGASPIKNGAKKENRQLMARWREPMVDRWCRKGEHNTNEDGWREQDELGVCHYMPIIKATITERNAPEKKEEPIQPLISRLTRNPSPARW
ncbi:hypothetical protein DFH07DRAFT_766701 [Mycena maculata]|uniref:Uncharacterized protein n=1 Tax=Mycena maculata TaxID=230809 RepID=A0AAD7NVB3_9AGAR|nr:hypothetical protein DFH07DRAFT_766701 [Mycena maculata]